MKDRINGTALPVFALYALVACATGSSRAADAPATNAAPCTPFEGMSFLCGPTGAEDLVRVPGTPWLIASGLAQPPVPGRLQLIDTASHRWSVGWPVGDTPRLAHDRARFPDCATSPDSKSFTAHGLSLRTTGAGRAELLVVNHGGREAIEFFDVEIGKAPPRLTWIGCVTMPADTFVNSVAMLPNGGFLATRFYTPSQGGMGAIAEGKVTGAVLEWAPGAPVRELEGTRLVGANGIEQSDDGRVIFVAQWGTRELVRFDRRGPQLKKDGVKLEFSPDNLRWGADGSLLAAGQKLGPPGPAGGFTLMGWGVARIDPATLAVRPVRSADANHPMQGISVAVEVDKVLWVGPFRGDRVGYLTLPITDAR